MMTIYPEKQYSDAADFCRRFLSDAPFPRYVLGRNEYAASIARMVDLDGFIDDYTSDVEFMGKPIEKMDRVPKESLVVSAVIFVVPLTAMERLKSNGLACLDYFKFLHYSGLALKQVDFMRKAREDIERNVDKYQWVYNRLADETSKNILERLVNFRFSGDLNYMTGFRQAVDHQYFEDFLDLAPGEVFVDGGGFDGQTSVDFIRRCPEYRSIHIFEPDPANISLARVNLSKHPNIHFYPMGLSDGEKTMRFSSGGGSASKVSGTGDMDIKVDSIDNTIREPVSLIKMDIEGDERAALQGAREHILNDYPKLAICCYHKFDDLWAIPEQVVTMRNDYAVYVRHYTDGLHETVMYFVPNA